MWAWCWHTDALAISVTAARLHRLGDRLPGGRRQARRGPLGQQISFGTFFPIRRSGMTANGAQIVSFENKTDGVMLLEDIAIQEPPGAKSQPAESPLGVQLGAAVADRCLSVPSRRETAPPRRHPAAAARPPRPPGARWPPPWWRQPSGRRVATLAPVARRSGRPEARCPWPSGEGLIELSRPTIQG